MRSNSYSNILWMKGAGTIGTHFHRGTVTMVCITGSVRYLEYDWVATPGGLILEVPGESHTLVTDHPEGCKLFGWMQGPIEFYDNDANLIETVDVWWMMNHYESYCKEQGLRDQSEAVSLTLNRHPSAGWGLRRLGQCPRSQPSLG